VKKTIMLCAALLAVATTPSASFAKIGDAFPIDYFAVRNAISNVQVSPDGKYMAFTKVNSKKGNPIIEVYETANMSKKPFRAGGKKLEIQGFSWVGNDEMVVGFRGKIRSRVKGFNDGIYANKLAKLSMKTKKFDEFKETGLNFAGNLPQEPNKILISYQEGVENGRIAEGEVPRPPSYYELDLKSGAKKLVLKGNTKYERIRFDSLGNPRTASSFDADSDEIVTYHRSIDGSDWTEIHRRSEDSFETFNVAGYIPEDPSRIHVIAHNGNDKAGLWKFNVNTKRFEDLVFRHKDVDVGGVRLHSNQFENPDKIIGAGYSKDKPRIQFFDDLEGATYAQLEGLIPNAYSTRIITRSNDGNTFVVFNTGPKDPGSYYLFNNGKFNLVGKRKGQLTADGLSDVEYIEYPARDGRTIPAYVTKPKGAGPHPLVVLPHGGPFVSETIVFDEWSQMLANNGYMVIQPQYRGSTGRGIDHYTSAFIPSGQGGYKMQDDKDDGAKYLIKSGLVDKDRVAMFGWSYGGYAALVAASREDQIYQCAVAGAAVADNNQQVNYYRFNTRGTQKTEQLNFWDGSISPIEEAAKVNIPLLLVHGDVDQRVPFKHFEKYTAELDKNNIAYQSLVLEGADHFLNTLTYDHKSDFYTKLIDYLDNDCGPGGL